MRRPRSDPPTSALRAVYQRATFAVEFPEGAREFRPGESVDIGGPPPFALITAFNPGKARPSSTANVRANAGLRRELVLRGLLWLPASGYDDARTHEEPSFAVFAIDLPAALALAREFGQSAIFWWDGRRGSIAFT